MTKAPEKTLRGAGRVAFLARVADFRELVEAGHPLLGIYESNRDDLGISYSQFARYVAKYIRSPSHEQEKPQGLAGGRGSAQSAPAAVQAPPAPTPAPAGDGGSSGAGGSRATGKPGSKPGGKPAAFQHDADSGNRDDLI